MNATAPVLAAGAVVWRPGEGGTSDSSARPVEVLLIHRPKYDDWSLPKGKLDPGEHLLAAAVREVTEETGLRVRLGVPLPAQQYDAGRGLTKHVRYWAARPVGDDGLSGFRPNAEVDQVRWAALHHARELLTYDRDRAVLAEFAVRGFRAEPLIVLRHAQAMRRDTWTRPDRERPLASEGAERARALVPLLAAYGVRRVLSSDAVRCTATVRPYADATGLRVEVDHRLSEEGHQGPALRRRLDALLRREEATVLSTHRQVLPSIFTALGVVDPALQPGAFVVVHHEGTHLHASEHHRP